MFDVSRGSAGLGWLGVVLALVVACSGGSSGETPSSTMTPEAAPTEAATSTPALPTSTAAGEIDIEDDERFVAWTNEALELIALRAAGDYARVVASIRTIKSVEAGSGIFVMTKLYQVGNVTAFAPGFERRLQLVWYAGTIVHDACHSARYERGEAYRGKEAELACLAVQRRALLKLDSDTYIPGYVQGLIDNADDPANEYWNNPNRHW